MTEQSKRLEASKAIAAEAGAMALAFFRDASALNISSKGTQDFVSNADLEVETFVRGRIAEIFPEDGIVGEEHDNVPSTSGWIWVIDPIDGTANFVNAIPAWCVILACVFDDQTETGVIYEPCTNEMFWGARDAGAFMNDAPMSVSKSTSLDDGSVGVGMNGRTPKHMVPTLISSLADVGGLYYRNASGGLMLAYVAAGRLIGYSEPHMNAWDCLAGQLLISEAGGRIEVQSAKDMLLHGGRVIAGGPGIYDALFSLSEDAYRT